MECFSFGPNREHLNEHARNENDDLEWKLWEFVLGNLWCTFGITEEPEKEGNSWDLLICILLAAFTHCVRKLIFDGTLQKVCHQVPWMLAGTKSKTSRVKQTRTKVFIHRGIDASIEGKHSNGLASRFSFYPMCGLANLKATLDRFKGTNILFQSFTGP